MDINRDSALSFQEEELRRNQSLIRLNATQADKGPRKRLQALDVHRGLTMLGMILVDNSGPSPMWILDHAEWNGLTPADLIFPSFIFIMGIAIPLAVSEKNPLKLRSIIRIFALFAIGILLNLFGKKFNFLTFRIMGILQRLSLCYGFTLLIHVLTGYGRKALRIYGALAIILTTTIYFVCMEVFQNTDPQCNRDNRFDILCNFGRYADSKVLTYDHMFHVDGKPSTDPEGLFTTLNALVTAYAGYYFSLLMFDCKNNIKKLISQWLILSILLGGLAYPLTFLMPLNKKIWSTSFTCLTIGVAGATLAFLVILIDVVGKDSERYKKVVKVVTHPFVWLGRNPLAIFVLMDVLAIVMIRYIFVGDVSLWSWFYHNAFKSWIDEPILASTIFSIFFVLLWTGVAGIMYRFNLFVRL